MLISRSLKHCAFWITFYKQVLENNLIPAAKQQFYFCNSMILRWWFGKKFSLYSLSSLDGAII